MKEFDWEKCKEDRHAETYAFLKQAANKPLSEGEFVKNMLGLPHNHRKTSDNKYAKEYQYLKKAFGFFQ